jgi:ribosomal protein L33
MSKYNGLKFLKETKARYSYICERCGGKIGKGEIYYSESIGRVNAPGIKLKKFCSKCGKELLVLAAPFPACHGRRSGLRNFKFLVFNFLRPAPSLARL